MGELIPIDKAFGQETPKRKELDSLVRSADNLISELPSIVDQRRLLAIYLQYTEAQSNFMVSDQDLDIFGKVIKETKKRFLNFGVDADGIEQLIEKQHGDAQEKLATNV